MTLRPCPLRIEIPDIEKSEEGRESLWNGDQPKAAEIQRFRREYVQPVQLRYGAAQTEPTLARSGVWFFIFLLGSVPELKQAAVYY